MFILLRVGDNHYMDPSLLIKDGPAFQHYLVTTETPGRVMLSCRRQFMSWFMQPKARPCPCSEISPKMWTSLSCLVHLYLSNWFRPGSVRVITGNHDIYNPHSYQYDSAQTVRISVRIIQIDLFRLWYSDALYTDPYSWVMYRTFAQSLAPRNWLLQVYNITIRFILQERSAGYNEMGTWPAGGSISERKNSFWYDASWIVEQFTESTIHSWLYVDNYTDVSNQLMNAA